MPALAMPNLYLVTEGTRPPTLPDELWDAVRPLLQKTIGVGKAIRVKEIADALGVSSPSVSAWINDKNRPNSYNLLKVIPIIQERCHEPSVQDATQRILGKLHGASVGSLAAADQAARRLTEFDGVPADDAWLLMRSLVGGDADSLYFEARRVLAAGMSVRERHDSRLGNGSGGAPPGKTV